MATEYGPDDDLHELLGEVLQEATVSYGDEQDLELNVDIEGFSAIARWRPASSGRRES